MVIVFVSAAFIYAPLRAQSISEEKLESIRQHCSNSKIVVQKLQKQNAVSRINRGRAYDQLLKQVEAFNNRLTYNKIDASSFSALASQLKSEVDVFRASYTIYDESLTSAIKIDCRQQPAEFYDYIVKSRTDRSAVGAEVKKIDELIRQYRQVVVDYQKTLPETTIDEGTQ